MNAVDIFLKQQTGRFTWRSYDNCLTRLRCSKNEDFKNILPTNNADDETQDTPIFACKFAKKEGYKHILALANEDGRLAVHDTNSREARVGKQIHHNAIFDITWVCNEMKLVTVSGDHTARLVDVNQDDLHISQIFTGHSRSVKTVAARRDEFSTFATGGRDGCILVWDTRTCTNRDLYTIPDHTIFKSHQIKSKSLLSSTKKKLNSCNAPAATSVTGLVFQDGNTLISCGAGDGTIKFWDLRKTYKVCKREPTPKYTFHYPGSTTRNGFSNLLLDNAGIRLYASCLDNTIYCYNIANYNPKPIMQYLGHQNSTFYVKASMSHDDNYLLSGSSDQNAYIWNVNHSEPLVRLQGHNAEVTCVAWRASSDTTLVTCSDDMRHKIWRIGPEMVPVDWKYEGRGEAETVPRMARNIKRSFEVDEFTSHCQTKKLKKCERCLYQYDKACENCNYFSNTNKRIAINDGSAESKRKNIDKGPRCLFRPVSSQQELAYKFESCFTPLSSKRKRYCEPDSEEDSVHCSKSIYLGKDSDAAKSSEEYFARLGSIEITEAESKLDHLHHHGVSTDLNCKHLDTTSINPTSNLPNFVMDGCAPHLHSSPQKRPDKDWLTKMRFQKSLISKFEELASGIDVNLPVKVENTTKRCKTPKTPRRQQRKCPSPQSPLLKFFRVTSNVKDGQCSPKSSLNSIYNQSKQPST